MKDIITLAHGAGGKEMDELIESLGFDFRGDWLHSDDDASVLDIGDQYLVFTTDSFIVDPIFFPGGNIGDLAMCGTINDLVVMGARPLGISIALVIEEGFSQKELQLIVKTIKKLSKETKVPVVTGDTKVMDRGKLDKIIVNSAGVGLVDKKRLLNIKPESGDKVVLSGGLGEHAVALLSKRFDYQTSIKSDSKPLIDEISSVHSNIKTAKDTTRGGIAATLNEICGRFKIGMILDEEKIPAEPEVIQVTEMLGINLYELACEGRFVCVCREGEQVVQQLKKFNNDAAIIGEIVKGDIVTVQTVLGRRVLPKPRGRIVPRIC